MFLREQSWRNSFALKRCGKWAYFLSQSSRRIGEMIVFLRALRNNGDVMGSALVFQFMYVEKNLFYYKEILHFAAFRSEWQGSVFYSRLEICFSGRIIFETQRFFYLLYVLRKQSWRNSFALKLYGNCYLNRLIFYHKVHGELAKWLCFWEHWGTSEMFWEAHWFFSLCM